MKKYTSLLVVALIAIVGTFTFMAQYPAYYTLIVRTLLDVKGEANVADSLRVGTSTPIILKSDGTITSKAITMTGLFTTDSLVNAGEARFGGLVGYDQRFSVKNDAVNSNLVNFFNSRNSSMFKVDSSGLITSVGLTTTGAITATSQTIASGAITSSGKSTLDSVSVVGQSYFGAVVDYLSKIGVKNGLILYAQSWFNSRGTAIFRLDSVGTPIESGSVADTGAFSGTLASAAVYIQGALSTDVYEVHKRVIQGVSTATPTDSCILSYMAKPDSLIVLRQGTFAASGGAMPSGTKFSWRRVRLD